MKLLQVLVLLLCLPSAAHALSASDSCSQLLQEKATVRASEKVNSWSVMLRLIFARGSFVSPEWIQASSSGTTQEVTAPQGEEAADLTIFTLGHSEKVTDQDNVVLKKLSDESRRDQKAIQDLLKTKDTEACVARAKELNWSFDEIDTLAQDQKAALLSIRHLESQESLKAARSSLRSHGNRRIVPIDSWGEALEAMREKPSAGIAMIAHADPYGRLYDSLREELPTDFFQALPSAVRFIGVFSCDSDRVTKAYLLDSLAGREVLIPQIKFPFNATDSTPLLLFPAWLHKIDSQGLLKLEPDADTSPEQECSMTLSGLEQGTVYVSILGKPVGVWSSAHSGEPRLFPCAWLGSAPLFAETANLDDVPPASTDFSISVEDEGKQIHFSRSQIFTTSQSTFRSALFEQAQ